MSSLFIAGIVFGCTLAGLFLGLVLRKLLPEHHTKDDSKDVMKSAAGMMATLVALVIGLLVSSAKSSFDAANAALTQSGAKMIALDRLLIRYGPEANGIRLHLRQSVAAGVKTLWPEEAGSKADIGAAEAATGMEDVYDMIRALAPQGESQQYLKAQALQLSSDLVFSRWMLVEQNQNALPTVFLVALVFWLAVLFTCFGLLAPRNATAFTALTVCALSMAGAIYLILELNRPFEGSIKVSSAPLVKALSIMGK